MSHSHLDLFAMTAPGLENLASAELRELGLTAQDVSRAGVAWSGSLDDVYMANLWTRTASRVLVRIASFRATTFFELERKAKRVPWDQYVTPGRSVRFRVTCRKSRLYHSDAVAQRLMAAVAPVVGDATLVNVAEGRNDREDGDGDAPREAQDAIGGQLFIVRVDHDLMTISADSSGDLLHRRGYRQAIAKAPLRETLAAAMVLASGWDRRSPLVDPMCGSGTIAIEAAMLARNMAPGCHRDFAFLHWPTFDTERWTELIHRANGAALTRAPGIIRASDRDQGAVRAALDNAERAGVADDVDVGAHAISAVEPAGERGWVVTNPPYGVRIGDSTVRNLYAQFGKVMRETFPGWSLGILSADRGLERQVGISFVSLFETSNGGIPVRFVQGR